MDNKLTDEEILKLASQRVEAKRGFFIHLAIYVCVNVFLFLIWYFVAGRGYPWYLWVIFGWGIAIVINAIAVFIAPKGSSWEKRQLQKEIQNLKKN
jgi:uncharacterized protein (DUF486 family)